LRPVTATLMPSPIITRPPVAADHGQPPRRDRTNHCRAVPAMAAHALSRTSAITGNSEPRMSICAGHRQVARGAADELGQPTTKNTIVLGFGRADHEPVADGAQRGHRLQARGERLGHRGCGA